MKTRLLRIVSGNELEPALSSGVDERTLSAAEEIVSSVRTRGEEGLLEHAIRLGDLDPFDGRPLEDLILTREQCEEALAGLAPNVQGVLRRTAERIRTFAAAQRDCLLDLSTPVPGGRAGHRVRAIESAGCYAPGGRFPLPSSALMTAIPARVAGVERVWLASPRPGPVLLAAAALGEVDGVLPVGGAQAIAALALGCGPVPRCDVVVGPGNRWVTAAKRILAGEVGIDFLAGPTELVVIADGEANPRWIAADLLAQAEHDPDAFPVLISWERGLFENVEQELALQLGDLPSAAIASQALSRGFGVVVDGVEEAISVSDRLAPEHLQLQLEDPTGLADRLAHYGSVFFGGESAEVFGDYGAGPNHVLPTSGSSRFSGGLSVFHFLRIQTWLKLDACQRDPALLSDTAALARLEGLEGHARAADCRGR